MNTKTNAIRMYISYYILQKSNEKIISNIYLPNVVSV